MSWLIARFYDRVMAPTEAACLAGWRRELYRGLHGRVLEIGAGTGASLPLYPGEVSQLVLSEPDRHMRRRLLDSVTAANRPATSVIDGGAESVAADDDSFDFVVSSLVCCSVASLDTSLAEARRVLKPGGRLVFLEHVAAAEGSARRRWQNRLTPLWKRLAGNCHLNRETERAIVEAGFEIEDITRESMRKAPPLVRPTIRGRAVKR